MPIKPIPGSKENTLYYLICYDKEGNERHDDPDVTNGILSDEVIRLASSGQYTDILFSSHGWKSDIATAIDQYDRWTAAMVACEADIARLKARPQGFKPLVIGLHWPSLPFGMEDHEQPSDSEEDFLFDFSTPDERYGSDIYTLAEESIANNEQGKQAVKAILDSAIKDMNPSVLDTQTTQAIKTLLTANYPSDGNTPSPAEEIPDTDVQTLFDNLKDAPKMQESLVSFGGSNGRGPLLNLLTQFSAWTMKARARTFGENGGAKLLRKLLTVTQESVQFHLMGHSFGAVVISSTVTGKNGNEPLPRPVDTVYLVQGAVSYWAYCKDIPAIAGTPGYYHKLSDPEYMKGPILVTRTENDTAVKTIYLFMAKLSLSESVAFDPMEQPKHGALGMFGARGAGIAVHDMKLLPLHGNYGFTPRTFFNLHASDFINKGNPLTGGAHNDIGHPEVAHAFWSAIQ